MLDITTCQCLMKLQDMKKSKHTIVIPECLYRESSDFTAFKDAGSPTQAFGDDDTLYVNGTAVSFYV